jgi:hypothetical protein
MTSYWARESSVVIASIFVCKIREDGDIRRRVEGGGGNGKGISTSQKIEGNKNETVLLTRAID